MSRRPIEPHGNTGGPLTPYLVLGLGWAALAAVWLAWAAGSLAARVTGHPSTGPGFGADFVAALIRAEWHALWPAVNPALVAVVYAVLLAAAATVAFGGWMWWQARRPYGDDPLPSLAEPGDVAPLTLPAVADKARRRSSSKAPSTPSPSGWPTPTAPASAASQSHPAAPASPRPSSTTASPPCKPAIRGS